ncbi:hypothetical protein DSO57_1025936 [Entomophthora muscae]|uniref:Uncharacterized protein n=1 Tax=Entomophthora muscae TaxID=34485 RepID=A0ACC2SES7_9FUNG|nr:hypothetical protein DSO57_1025936 [Entomophthora muscae]
MPKEGHTKRCRDSFQTVHGSSKETFLASKPSVASDLPSLKRVQFSLPIETIDANFPEIGQSLKQYFDTLAPLGVHVLSLHYELYSECTYTDISFNKVKVRAIIDSGAPIDIVSTRLVRKLGIAPEFAHTRVYVTASKHTTMSEGAYSAVGHSISKTASQKKPSQNTPSQFSAISIL